MAKLSKVRYHWGLLFTWDHTMKHPFVLYVLEVLKEIPMQMIEKSLTTKNRHDKFNIEANGERESSLFCKIEYGKYKNTILILIWEWIITYKLFRFNKFRTQAHCHDAEHLVQEHDGGRNINFAGIHGTC